MKDRDNPNVLIVEGHDDLRVVAELIERSGVEWPTKSPPIHIDDAGSVQEILRPGYIAATLKRSNLRACRILVDADNDANGRWNQLCNILKSLYPDLPQQLPEDGFIHTNLDQPKVGVWIMPDNFGEGMLETLLLASRPVQSDLHTHITTSLDESKRLGAPWREVHRAKAELHTWLAWHDPPGCQMHIAVRKGWFEINSPQVTAFQRWARELFSL